MKPPKRLNPIQVAASAAGAVLAAVIASFFGVTGTIIGTAIGSIVATTVSAIVWESIERGHEAVRQVVVKDHTPLLHRGATESAGDVTGAGAHATAVEAHVDVGLDPQMAAGPPADDTGQAHAETAAAGDAEVRQQSPLDPTRQEPLGVTEATGAGMTTMDVTGPRRLVASSRSGRPAEVRRTSATPGRGRRGAGAVPRRWVMVALSVVGVFVVALGVVTVVEVIAGKPLASITGASKTTGGTTAGIMFGATPTTTTTSTTSTTTTSTTAPTSTTTTMSSTSSTTTTTPTSSTSSTSTTATSTTTPPASGGTGTSGGTGG